MKTFCWLLLFLAALLCHARSQLIEIESRLLVVTAADAAQLGLPGTSATAPDQFRSVLTPPERESLLQKLEGRARFVTTPRVTTRSGQRAVIEVIREFRFPTRFTDSADRSGLLLPEEFKTQNAGLTAEFEPVAGPDGLIDLTTLFSIVSIDRMITFAGGKRLFSPHPPAGDKSWVQQPVFDIAKIDFSVILRSGETALLGGLPLPQTASGEPWSQIGFLPELRSTPESPPARLYCMLTTKIAEPTPAGARLKSEDPVFLQVMAYSIPIKAMPSFIDFDAASSAPGVFALRSVLKQAEAATLFDKIEKERFAVMLQGEKLKVGKGQIYVAQSLMDSVDSSKRPPTPGNLPLSILMQASVGPEGDINLRLAVTHDNFRLNPGGGAFYKKDRKPERAAPIPDTIVLPEDRAPRLPASTTTVVSIWSGQTVALVARDRENPANVIIILVEASGLPKKFVTESL